MIDVTITTNLTTQIIQIIQLRIKDKLLAYCLTFCRPQFLARLAVLGSQLRVSEGWNINLWLRLFSRSFGEESASELIHVVNRISFLAVARLRSPFPFWPSAEGSSQLLGHCILCYGPPSISSHSSTVKPLSASNLSYFPFYHKLKKLCF